MDALALNPYSKHKLEARAQQIQSVLEKAKALGTWPPLLRYLTSAVFVAGSYLVCQTSDAVASYPLFMFMPAIILASFIFGRRVGYFATLLSAVVVLVLFMDFRFPLSSPEAGKVIAAAAFTFVGLFTAYSIEALRVTIDVLAENARLKQEKRGLEQELFHAQKMEAVGRAISILAHDFKNILSPIMSIVYILRKRFPQMHEDVTESLGVLEQVHRNGIKLADDIRSFGRKEQADCTPVDLNRALRDSLFALRRGLKKPVSLELRLLDGAPPIYVDPALLQRALANIVDNAEDAMPDGGIITIGTSVAMLDGIEYCAAGRCAVGEYVCLTVKDNGTGMPPDVRARMFEPFFTTKPTGQGTGLGMAMVADFARHAQGCVTVDSDTHRGTTVTLFLPPYRAAEAA
ncbi:MAG TPA: ATP-binding protein [Woeseiaceae bacterium]|jgi:signal transduction histidine kinase|nr:ATP-binding protein [Woeseiaceae bacterium]